MKNYSEISETELATVNGGISLGWLSVVQPAYDFLRGVAKGFTSAIKKHG